MVSILLTPLGFQIVLPQQSPRTKSLDLIKLLAAVGAGLATIAVKITNAYAEIADGSEEPLQEQLKEVLPVVVAFATYAAKILVQFR